MTEQNKSSVICISRKLLTDAGRPELSTRTDDLCLGPLHLSVHLATNHLHKSKLGQIKREGVYSMAWAAVGLEQNEVEVVTR